MVAYKVQAKLPGGKIAARNQAKAKHSTLAILAFF
jgi:hypothetical protein